MKQHKFKACPAWLGLSKDRLSYVSLPNRAATVKAIFEDAACGIGADVIVRRLTERGVEPFGSVPWQASTISNLLVNRAVIGEFQSKALINGKKTAVGDIIENHYPAVIKKSLFEAVQVARSQNLKLGRGGKGSNVTNLFTSVIYCAYCGSRMKSENISVSSNSKCSRQNFVCNSAFTGRTCVPVRWPHQQFEEAFFRFLSKISTVSKRNTEEIIEVLVLAQAKSVEDEYQRRSLVSHLIKKLILRIEVSTIGHEIRDNRKRTRAENVTHIATSRHFRVRFADGVYMRFYPELNFLDGTDGAV